MDNETATAIMVGGIKYITKDAEMVKDWRGVLVPSCDGCAGSRTETAYLCHELPNCRANKREDGRNLIFVAETKEKNNG